MHYSIESKDKKNQKFKDTKRTQIIASQQKANNPVSDLNLGNKQKSEFLLQNKTKPLKQRGSTAHQIKKKTNYNRWIYSNTIEKAKPT